MDTRALPPLPLALFLATLFYNVAFFAAIPAAHEQLRLHEQLRKAQLQAYLRLHKKDACAAAPRVACARARGRGLRRGLAARGQQRRRRDARCTRGARCRQGAGSIDCVRTHYCARARRCLCARTHAHARARARARGRVPDADEEVCDALGGLLPHIAKILIDAP